MSVLPVVIKKNNSFGLALEAPEASLGTSWL